MNNKTIYHSTKPIYQQVQNLLLSDLINKNNIGDKIPTEVQLCEQYNVSRITIRQALDNLVNQGYLERYKKRGTFIKNKVDASKTGLDRKPSSLINIIIPYTSAGANGVFNRIIYTIEKSAFEKGYQVIINNIDNDFDRFNRLIDSLVQTRSTAGIIFFPLFEFDENKGMNMNLLRKFKENNLPVVIIDNLPSAGEFSVDYPVLDFDYVIPDNLYGGYLATKHLIDTGHKKVAYIGGNLNHAGYMREQGFLKAVKEFGIMTYKMYRYSVRETLIPEQQTTDFINDILDKGITAIFAEHDGELLGIFKHLQDLGIKVPEQIAFIGYDDMDFCTTAQVPFSTIRQPVEQEVKLATEILINKIENKNGTVKQAVLPVELIIRESSVKRI
jgi:DNA-binding LacI/PurR family transcriptional regulator